MNKLFCKLTGGHKFSKADTVYEQSPDSRDLWVINKCTKCGTEFLHIEDSFYYTIDYRQVTDKEWQI